MSGQRKRKERKKGKNQNPATVTKAVVSVFDPCGMLLYRSLLRAGKQMLLLMKASRCAADAR